MSSCLRFESDKCIDGLTCQFIWSSDSYNSFFKKKSGESLNRQPIFQVNVPAVSATPLCIIKADSISAVDNRCPETLMTSTREKKNIQIDKKKSKKGE